MFTFDCRDTDRDTDDEDWTLEDRIAAQIEYGSFRGINRARAACGLPPIPSDRTLDQIQERGGEDHE